MNYKQLRDLLSGHESTCPQTHLTAGITFSSFGPDNQKNYSWRSRTYLISSDNKAFQADKGGYSIFGSCLDGSDRCLRLSNFMCEEHGGKDGWVVEDCFLIGYLVIECSDTNISTPQMFYAREDAVDYMLSQLAENGELDATQLKKEYSSVKNLLVEDTYGAGRDSAWLVEQCGDWHWRIQTVYIYDLLHLEFPEPESPMRVTSAGDLLTP